MVRLVVTRYSSPDETEGDERSSSLSSRVWISCSSSASRSSGEGDRASLTTALAGRSTVEDAASVMIRHVEDWADHDEMASHTVCGGGYKAGAKRFGVRRIKDSMQLRARSVRDRESDPRHHEGAQTLKLSGMRV